MADKISVLIVDDSALMRSMIGKIVESSQELRVAGKAMNGKFALNKIPNLDPDVIVLDLEMPEMNGIEFLKERRRLGIHIPVIILSSLARRGARITMEALSLGASDFILKPTGTDQSELQSIAVALTDVIKVYGGNYKSEKTDGAPRRELDFKTPAQQKRDEKPVVYRKVTDRVDVVAIGISTGGPNALREVFKNLDVNLPVPILVVQHMPAGFTAEFAQSLDRVSPLVIKEAEDGDLLKPGRIFIAAGNYHLAINRMRLADTVRLTQEEPVNGHRPSADVLFSSAVKIYGKRILAVIMTGMGRDGAKGIGEIYHAGGLTVAQDSETSVVYGMPRVAFENGVVDSVVALPNMAETINRLVMTHQR